MMKTCKKCVLPETFPGIQFDEGGICNFCNEYKVAAEGGSTTDFTSEAEVKSALQKYRNPGRQYDVLVPLSGGVDSCFTLITLVENYQLRPLAFHSDHGWDDPEATRNVEKLCKELDVDLVIWKNDLGFMRKLFKYFNESNETEVSPCFACGNMLYLNGLELADHFDIPLVINGYSKGQAAMMHDDYKAHQWFSKMIEIAMNSGDQEFFEKFQNKWNILKKQVIYRERRDLENPVNSGKILFVPFFVFKFYKTDKQELQAICRKRFDWRPIKASYPTRTTNCDMIWLNSFRDLNVRGYTHYHDEYSTLIRSGEITREQALKDLELNPPDGMLEKLATEIHFDLGHLDSHSKEKILLVMLPFWSPLIPPLGIACLKSFLTRYGYPVTTVDANIEDRFRQFHSAYFETLARVVPENKWGNYFVTGKDVLQNHLMAHLHFTDPDEYRELVKILVAKTFYTDIDRLVIEEMIRLVQEFYAGLELFFDHILEREAPDVIGFSVFETNLPTSIFVARLAREKNPAVRTVMGGGVFSEQLAPGSPNWDLFLAKNDCIDAFFIGEGELLLLKYLQNELPKDKNIYSIQDIGNQTLPLAEAPVPDFDDFDLDAYLMAASYGSRSCPFQCKFCSETVQWGNFRKKGGKQIAAELKYLHQKSGRQLFLLCDSLLNPVATDLANTLIDEEQAIYWDGYLRADKPVTDRETTLMWRRGGFYKAKLGIESGSQRVLDLMNKKITVDQVKEAVISLADAGIKTSTCWVIGFPGETEEDFQQTLNLIEELQDHIYEVWGCPFYYYPTGQVDTRAWADRRYSLYPERHRDMLRIDTWVADCMPSREEAYRRMNRFAEHCKTLGVPNPFTVHELYKADQRWKRLHENAVPSFEEFEDRGSRVDDRHKVKKLKRAPRTRDLDGDFTF